MKDYTASNIKALRKIYGETQLELALALGFESPTTICNYEHGTRNVESEVRSKIAGHYMITENTLVHVDLSSSPLLKIKLDEIFTETTPLLPIITSHNAIDNINFAKAYLIHMKCDRISDKSSIPLDIVDKMLEYYSKAYDEGIVEAGANLLSFFFYISIHIRFTGQIEPYYNIPDNVDFQRAVVEYVLKKYDDEESEDIQINDKMKETVERIDAYACDVIDKAKNQGNIDLVEYLRVLRYFFGTIDIGNMAASLEMAGCMILDLCKSENEYALDFAYEFFGSFL